MLYHLVSRGLVALNRSTYRIKASSKSLPLALAIVLSFNTVLSQPGVKTDLGIYPDGDAPALPSAGGKLIDPVFGTEIMRVTDERDGANFGTAYAYWATFNSNSTRVFVHEDNVAGLIYSFDPDNFQIGSKDRFIYPPGNGLTTDEDAYWSARDPDTLFVHRGAIIWAYNVRTRAYSVVGDMTSYFPAGTYFVQMTVSRNDDVFTMTVKNADYSVRGYAVWKDSANTVIRYVETPDLDETQIDKSGRFLSITTPFEGAGVIQTRIVDLQTMNVTDLTDNAPGYAPGHGDYGMGTVVAHDNWTNRITFRNLASPLVVSTVLSFGNDWAINYHLSLLADNEAWALMSVYGSGPVFERELVMVATDGSQRVRRFAHHYSKWIGYYDTPRANVSRDGRFAAFTSNWGGRSRRDLFIAKVPSDGSVTTPAPTSPNQVSWTNIQGTISEGGTVSHSGTVLNGMAKSTQVVSRFSGFEWTFTAGLGQVWVGLGNKGNESASSGAEDLPFCFDGNAIKEFGVPKATLSVADGDLLRIEINRKGQVIYKKNGVTAYQSSSSAAGRFYLVFKSREIIGTKIRNAHFNGINYGA